MIIQFEKRSYCHYNYYCNGDNCYSNPSVLDFTPTVLTKDGSGIKELKIRGECVSNGECLSNICNNKQCDISGITQCIVPRGGSSINCGKPSFETCQADAECASTHCIDGACEEVFKVMSMFEYLKKSFIYLGIFILLVICCCIGICICCCKKRDKN